MPLSTIETASLSDNSVTTAKIAVGAVEEADLATAVVPLGVNQTWQNVTGSRATGTTYTNTTGRPIFVAVTYSGIGQTTTEVSGINIFTNGNSTGYNNAHCVLVPTGATYRMILASGSQALNIWTELR